MYRAFTFRLTDPPFPVTLYTKVHPEVRVVAYNVGRDPDIPLPNESFYVVRAPKMLHAHIEALFAEHLEVLRKIPSPEPGVLILHARFQFPEKGPLRGFLTVLLDAVGTILEYHPIVMENGMLQVSMLTLPRGDSTVRLKALAAYASEKGIGFEIAENRPVPMLPIAEARFTQLDLLEWQVIQALDAAGLYDLDSPDADEPAYVRAVIEDLAEALGLEPHDLAEIRTGAERKLLAEFARARGRNMALSTPPGRPGSTRAADQDTPGHGESDDEAAAPRRTRDPRTL